MPGLYPFHSGKSITGYYSVFSNRNYIFCRRVCFRGIGFAVIYSGKISCEAQLAFRLRHFASQSIQALSDKSVPFQRAVTSETAKAWIKLWGWPRFGNLRKVNTDTRPFHPRSLFFFKGLPSGCVLFFRKRIKYVANFYLRRRRYKPEMGCLRRAHVDCEATLACSARIKDSAEDGGRRE